MPRKTTIMIIPELDVEEGYIYLENKDVVLMAPWLMRKLNSECRKPNSEEGYTDLCKKVEVTPLEPKNISGGQIMKSEVWETLIFRRLEEVSPGIIESPEYQEAQDNANGIALSIVNAMPDLLEKMHELEDANGIVISIVEKEYYAAGLRDGFQLAQEILSGKKQLDIAI